MDSYRSIRRNLDKAVELEEQAKGCRRTAARLIKEEATRRAGSTKVGESLRFLPAALGLTHAEVDALIAEVE